MSQHAQSQDSAPPPLSSPRRRPDAGSSFSRSARSPAPVPRVGTFSIDAVFARREKAVLSPRSSAATQGHHRVMLPQARKRTEQQQQQQHPSEGQRPPVCVTAVVASSAPEPVPARRPLSGYGKRLDSATSNTAALQRPSSSSFSRPTSTTAFGSVISDHLMRPRSDSPPSGRFSPSAGLPPRPTSATSPAAAGVAGVSSSSTSPSRRRISIPTLQESLLQQRRGSLSSNSGSNSRALSPIAAAGGALSLSNNSVGAAATRSPTNGDSSSNRKRPPVVPFWAKFPAGVSATGPIEAAAPVPAAIRPASAAANAVPQRRPMSGKLRYTQLQPAASSPQRGDAAVQRRLHPDDEDDDEEL